MASFTYSARDRSGEKIEGTLTANDRRGALAAIEKMGYVPISVKDAGASSAPAAAPKKGSLFSFERKRPAKMSRSRCLTFSTELSDLLASGMTLGTALNALAARRTGHESDDVIADLRDQIIQGTSLSNALAKHPASFPALYVNMIRAGEASGTVTETLARLVEHFERAQETRDKVITAMVYPAIVLAIGVLTVVFIMVSVMPKLSEVFKDLGSSLPAPTKALIAISEWSASYGLFLLAGLVVATLLAVRAIKTEQGRMWWHGFLLKVPLLKGILSAGAYSAFSRTLGTLLSNGVPVLKALNIVEQTTGNQVIAREIGNAKERVTDGTTISGPLAAGNVFPRILTDMLAVGEQTGNMPSALGHVAHRYDRQLDRSIKIFTTALEPILIVGMAIIVGFVALSILSAVFSLTSGLDAPT